MPELENDFDVPLIVTVPDDAASDLLYPTDRFPVSVIVLVVVIVPEIVRSLRVIPVPVIVLPVPLIVRRPPELWVNVPEPLVARSPATVGLILPLAVTPATRLRQTGSVCKDRARARAADPCKACRTSGT